MCYFLQCPSSFLHHEKVASLLSTFVYYVFGLVFTIIHFHGIFPSSDFDKRTGVAATTTEFIYAMYTQLCCAVLCDTYIWSFDRFVWFNDLYLSITHGQSYEVNQPWMFVGTEQNKTTSELCTYFWWWSALHCTCIIVTITRHISNINEFIGTFTDRYKSILISHQCRIYASPNRVSIGSHNGLSPIRRQAIILTRAVLLSNGHLGTSFCEIVIKIENYSLRKKHLKISSAKWRLFWPAWNESISSYRHETYTVRCLLWWLISVYIHLFYFHSRIKCVRLICVIYSPIWPYPFSNILYA